MTIKCASEASFANNIPANQYIKSKSVTLELAALNQVSIEFAAKRAGRGLLHSKHKADDECILIDRAFSGRPAHHRFSARLKPECFDDVW